VSFIAFCFVANGCYAQGSGPIVKVYAYEQNVLPGAPGGRGGPPIASAQLAGKRFSIYLETKNPNIAVDGVWMNGQYHEVRTEQKKAPVVLSGPVALEPNEKNTLVPSTTNPVIEVIVKDKVPGKSPTANVAEMLKSNAAVVQLTENGKPVVVPVAAFQAKDSVYLQ